jgi:hypothetical protein
MNVSKDGGWVAARTVALEGLEVTLSEPVLVARSHGYCWFPSLARLANGEVLARMSAKPDDSVTAANSLVGWSDDGGLTWDVRQYNLTTDCSVTLANGDELFLPYHLRPLAEGMGGPYALCRRGQRTLEISTENATVTGWPRADKRTGPKGYSGFGFAGQSVRASDGKYLATMYGTFEGQKRYSVVLAESADAVRWTIRGVVADGTTPLEGREGPCEPALCRLADGRLLCVFRMGAITTAYGKSYSSDEGCTWTVATAIANALSVEPSLAVMEDGLTVLSGGRPGVYLWFNADGRGQEWQRVEVVAPENIAPLTWAEVQKQNRGDILRSSCYSEVVPLGGPHLLVIYDHIPCGWFAIPPESKETNSVWVRRVTVTRR